VFPIVLILPSLVHAENPPLKEKSASVWEYSRRDDPLHGTSFDELVLEGKYLTPPSRSDGAPRIVLHCSGGKLKEGYLTVGAVVDRSVGGAQVEMRLDGKLSTESWTVGTDGQAVFLGGSIDLLKILYGHWLPHKEGKGDFIHQEIFGVQEAYGSAIVMQFDMPDPTPVLDSCTTVKRGKRF
jgi:hypothetical protein